VPVRATLIDAWLDQLRNRWPALLAVAGLTLGPAVAATTLVEVLENRPGAIINGSIVSDDDFTLWTRVVLSTTSGPAQVRVSVPLLVALAWFIGLGIALRVLAGHSMWTAWRRVRLAEWVTLGALLAVLALLGLHASVAVAGHLGGPLGGLTAGLWTYGLARLALALPAMLVDGRHLSVALRHAVFARGGHASTSALILVTVAFPAVLLALLEPGIMPTGRTWVADVWSAVVSLLEYLILVGTLPLQAAGLLGAYRAARPAAKTPASTDGQESPGDPEPSTVDSTAAGRLGRRSERDAPPSDDLELTVTVHDLASPFGAGYGPTARPGTAPLWVAEVMAPGRRRPDARTEDPAPARPSRRWLGIGAVALLSVVPAAVGPALLLINPNNLPVMTVARPEAGFATRPLTMAVLSDGTVVSVGPTQAALCRDAHCTDLELLTMPCVDGAPPAPEGAAMRSCRTEGPVAAADVTPDGTLLALGYRGRDVRLFWCRLEPTEDGQCRWGGATTLHRQPDQWWDRSMSVTALPDGGFAAAIIAPGPNDATTTVRLITCDRLDCPQPTVHIALTILRPDVAGLVDVSANPASGTLTLGYLNRSDEELYLGGCPAGCPDGPVLTRVGRWPDLAAGAFVPDRPDLQVAATATGPAATLGTIDAPTAAWPTAGAMPGPLTAFASPDVIVVSCADSGCATPDRSLDSFPMGVMLVGSRTGEVYVVGSISGHPFIGPLSEGWLVGLPSTLDTVVAAALGPDGYPRLLTHDDQGPAVVTLVRMCCLGAT
jgi:hypothetical protein